MYAFSWNHSGWTRSRDASALYGDLRISFREDYRRKGLVFNTQGFSFQEVEILSQNLNHSYNLTTWVKENKKKPIIAVSGKEYINIRDIMYPHIVKCMRYKLPENS
ncbi:MAG: hypothetical protein EOP45_20155 [Sphingobacteriaceae bacterium]|nr:MAG: hypothetical protein EOP45_20155 [Sphingobacteriaceae bacterium]